MDDLIQKAIDAAGGIGAWNSVNRISFDFTPEGPSLHTRGPVGVAAAGSHMRATVDTKRQYVAFAPFLAADQRAIYTPDRTWVETAGGDLVEKQHDPRGSLTQMAPGVPWSAPQLVYFFGYSLWLYLTLPFNFLKPGITVEEVEPWTEDGATWRGLRISYPADFPAHTAQQTHYFDADGLMRRQDYTVDVRQNLSAAHYLLDYAEFNGLRLPTRRRIFVMGDDRVPDRDRLLIAADLQNYKITRD
ncbi:hypothetical protein [Novosphingobium rosa]|uniref:hypothetical protein n=1 Tax=Novosphingobium rosa TaxID=76978 RepID=UPI00082DD0E0|nr:hypothetical protein [Novosphingobium rosa]